MKRSEFLKKLGIGLGVAMVAPKVLSDMSSKEEIIPINFDEEKKRFLSYDKPPIMPEGWYSRTFRSNRKRGIDGINYLDEVPMVCNRVKLFNKKEKEVADITLPRSFKIRFWDVITHDRDYIVSQREANYWIAKEA